MQRVKLVVVIPVGPNLRYDFIVDTLESIRYYTQTDYKVIIVDDSGSDVGAMLQRDDPTLDVVRTLGRQGICGGLYLGTSLGFQHALERYDFAVLLRLDSDALIIGPHAEDDAIAFFRDHPEVGLLGSYRLGCDGGQRDFTPPRRQLQRELSLWHFLTKPHHRSHARFLRDTVRTAVSHGYEFGEHCLAAATFYSAACVKALSDGDLLGRQALKTSRLGDDHLFGLLVIASGSKMADFATGDLPIAVSWRGLPLSPDELLRRKKKITHSTRFWNDLNEEQIREFFRSVRNAS